MRFIISLILAGWFCAFGWAQDVMPLRLGGWNGLQLGSGDYSSAPYRLEVPRIELSPQVGGSSRVTVAPVGVAPAIHYRYYGLAAQPGDYNFARQFSLDSRYGAAQLAGWETGALLATGSVGTFPGMGAIGTGGVTLMQDVGNFSFMASLSGEKYHLDNSLYNAYGVSGRISYRLGDRFTLNAFGSYYNGGGIYHTMSAMPYLGRSSYGATVEWQASDKFSIEAGAQRYYDPYSGRWQTAPVLIPQFNINGSKIGIDVGGIVYQLLNSAVRSNRPRGNGTIPPPM